MADHPDDWDDEFNTFYEQQRKKNDSFNYKSCHKACTRIHEILKSLPKSGKISGTLTLEIMNGIREVFSGISEDDALGIVTGLSKRRTELTAALNAIVERGVSIVNGKDAGNNTEEVVKWFRKAAEQGHADALYELGKCYDNGRDVAKDDAEAAEWFHKAAEQGDADAQYNFFNCFSSGVRF